MADFLALTILITYASLLLSFASALLRLILGPTLVDRVVALDLIAFLTIALIAVYAMDTQEQAFLDIGVTLALVAFLSTIAFARFILRRIVNNENKS